MPIFNADVKTVTTGGKAPPAASDVNLYITPPPGAAGRSGPNNLRIYSMHFTGAILAAGALTYNLSVDIGGVSTVIWSRTISGSASAGANTNWEYDIVFPMGWVLPKNDGTQFRVRITGPASPNTDRTCITVTYDFTNESS